MEKLFCYGTLQQKNVQQVVFGRLIDGNKDVLVGFILVDVEIMDETVIHISGSATHQVLKYTGNLSDEVKGTVYRITEEELKLADNYEVDDYTRTSQILKSGEKVWVYVASDEVF